MEWNVWNYLQSDKVEGKFFESFYHGRVTFHYYIHESKMNEDGFDGFLLYLHS